MFAVDNASLVRQGHRVGDLAQHSKCVGDRKPPAAIQALAKRLACHVRHDVVEQSSARSSGKHRQDVRVLQASRDERFTMKPCGAYLARRLGRKQLDHHLALERRLGREEQAAHTAGRQLALDDVVVTERRL
jgi:hypothetical protein